MTDFDIPLVDDTQVISSSRRSGIMLCYPFEEKRLRSWKVPYIIQPKLDGVRCRAKITPTEVMLISSENHFIDHVPHINHALLESFPNSNIELDGELYTHGMSFQDIISRTSRSKNQHAGSEDVEYHIFDIIDGHMQVDRLSVLNTLEDCFTSPCIKMVQPALVRDVADIMDKYYEFLAEGYEGFVIRDSYGYYQRKRYTGMMKFKPHQKDDYTICGYSVMVDMDGNIKPDILGKIICASMKEMPVLGEFPPWWKLPDGYFGVGTGFTHDQRVELWKCREALVGKKLKVKYQALTQGKNVPRFPVALEVIGD